MKDKIHPKYFDDRPDKNEPDTPKRVTKKGYTFSGVEMRDFILSTI